MLWLRKLQRRWRLVYRFKFGIAYIDGLTYREAQKYKEQLSKDCAYPPNGEIEEMSQ